LDGCGVLGTKIVVRHSQTNALQKKAAFLLPLTPMRAILLSSLLLATTCSFGQIPPGYYDSAQGYSGDSLKTKLNLIIKDHTEFPYTSSGTDVWDILKETDRDTLNPNNVLLIYSGWSLDANSEYDGGTGWSREHVWAKSRGDFGTATGPGTDVHALRPCDVTVNSARNSRWFAECTTEYIDGNGPTGSYTSSNEWVWKPNDNVKGDVARMIFYMATRYEGANGEPDLKMIDYIPSDNFTNDPIHAKLSDLYQWHLDDPVDDWERNRNNIIYYDYQNNRNPFIDHPEYATLIWGLTLDINQVQFDTTSTESKDLIKIVDLNGKEVEFEPNKVLFYLYSDGTVKKVFEVE